MRRIVKQKICLASLIKICNNILLYLLATSLKNLKFVKIYITKNSILLY